MNELQVYDDPGVAIVESVMMGRVSYQDYVEAGKKIVKGIACYQAVLAFYACQVCAIRHGGKSDAYYTITDYARDIGITPKTLQSWTLVYRNVIEKIGLMPEEVTKEQWKIASRVNDNMSYENRSQNRDNGTNRQRMSYKKQYPPTFVKELFDKESEGPTFKTELRSWVHSTRLVKNVIQKRDLSLAEANDLKELMEMCDTISDHINDYLSAQRKKK